MYLTVSQIKVALITATVVVTTSIGSVTAGPSAAVQTASGLQEDRARAAFANLSAPFVQNQGQLEHRVKYHAQGSDYAFAFTPGQVMLSFTGDDAGGARAELALRFVDPDPAVRISGQEQLDTRVNYFRGNDPQAWHSNLPSYAAVVYDELWPGVDMVLRDDQGELKYEFLVAPGASVEDIRLAYDRAHGVRLDEEGGLVVRTALGDLRDSAPVTYQDTDGERVAVDSRFLLHSEEGGEYSFEVGAYDHSRHLVIDPGLDYSTFVGGASMDRAEGVSVDRDGHAIVVGATQSTDFPTTAGALSRTFRGGIMDAYVAKLRPDGSGLVYATYLGGTPTPTRRGGVDNVETARDVAVDANGNAYVTGQTSSGNFPTTSGAFQRNLRVADQTATDAFVTKLSPTGALVYSTFLGGQARDDGRSIAVDGAGNAYIGGSTFASDFPTTSAAYDTTHNGGEDGFVTKLDATGSSLTYSTFLGGGDNELPDGVAVDSLGNAYLAGSTRSVDFPTTSGSFQPEHSGGGFADLFEGFVTKVSTSGSGLVYSTFLGGTRVDRISALAVDSSGSAYVVGGTQSMAFPTTAGAFDGTFDGSSKSFVTKLHPAGSSLVYSTFFRGVSSIALDAANNAWLAGGNGAGALTTDDAYQFQNNGSGDAYLAHLDATGTALLHATYLGGSQNDGASGIALDREENIYIAGTTMSPDFPTTAGALDRVWNGNASIFWGDAFVAKLDRAGTTTPPPPPPPPPTDTTAPSVSLTGPAEGATVSGTVSIAASATDDTGVTSVQFLVDGTLIATDTTAPYTASWDTTTAPNTTHTLTVRASDAAGNTGTATRNVTVDNADVDERETTTLTGSIDKNRTITRSLSTGSGPAELTLNWSERRVDLDLRVRDPNGTVIFFDGGSSRPKSGSFTVTTAGTYTFQLINNTSRRTSYTLSVTHASP